MSEYTLLIKEIKLGRAIPILGAGCSRSAVTKYGRPVLDGEQLAEHLATDLGVPYEGESLGEVVAAHRKIKGEDVSNNFITKLYKDCRATDYHKKLLQYTWRRIYTFNIDNVIEESSKGKSSQYYDFEDGLKDNRKEYISHTHCHVVHLNGYSLSGGRYIFSPQDYARYNVNQLSWYTQAGDDYINYTPIFIGTKYNEPLMQREVERIRSGKSSIGNAYIITPDDLTQIQRSALESVGITHIQKTFEEFIDLLSMEIGNSLKPSDIEREQPDSPLARFAEPVGKADVGPLSQFREVSPDELEYRKNKYTENREKVKRNFLSGLPADWGLVQSDDIIKFKDYNNIVDSLERSNSRVICVVGQAGSGKTTGIMQASQRYIRSGGDSFIFEFDENREGLEKGLRSLSKLNHDRILVIIDNLFVYGDVIADILSRKQYGNVVFVTSARTSEWRQRLSIKIGTNTDVIEINQFNSNEVDMVQAYVEANVTAPGFSQKTKEEKKSIILSSRRQLLILFKKVTGERSFDRVIEDEYAGLSDQFRVLLVCILISTLARVGISSSMINYVSRKLGFTGASSEVLEGLEGIVFTKKNGRVVGRHDLYARHIIDEAVATETVFDALKIILDYYAEGEMPVVRHFSREDHQLFKYIVNVNFMSQRRDLSEFRVGYMELLERYEKDYETEGNYWLQRGLVYRKLGMNQEALLMLQRSVQAHPDNDFAQHALAHQKLVIAKERRDYDRETVILIEEAVEELTRQDSRVQDSVDHYPAVTLSVEHCEVLFIHGQFKAARELAPRYFDRINQLDKSIPEDLSAIKSALAVLSSTGEWVRPKKVDSYIY